METARVYDLKQLSIREQIQQIYEKLSELLEIHGKSLQKTNSIIKQAITEFVNRCDNPALWCYGEHTRRLMADYIFEMRTVKYIIDDFCTDENSGFEIIHSNEIEEKNIDGIIISTFKYRNEISDSIRFCYSNIKYLDIYQILYEHGINLNCEYYAVDYPYTHYSNINMLKRKLKENRDIGNQCLIYKELLQEFIIIKDLKNAISCMAEYIKIDGGKKNREILKYLNRLYDMELQMAAMISENNVLMLCIDGLRRMDLSSEEMKKIRTYIEEKGYLFSNAYAASTSTYESLIPAYSGNNDLRTKYYINNEIEESDCPFILEAIKQKRKIHFYTDCCQYIKSNQIKMSDNYQTASEKLWDFLLDASDEKNGLFYIHILYESHYSYPNPYTERELIAEGSSILFDFLERNGEKMRTDYIVQHKDSLKYLDDLLAPFLTRLSCKMVIYADHGNILLKEDTGLEELKYAQLTFGEELIQVPMAIISHNIRVGNSDRICSIMELNNIIISLLKGENIVEKNNAYVKVVRSELYNRDLRYLYQKLGYSQGLKAFEVFLFQEGYKLAIYEDGTSEVYNSATDEQIEDDILKQALLSRINDEITVYT